MYNDSIKAENKIISHEKLSELFQMMGETLKKYQNISKMENQQNQMLQMAYQSYTFKDEGSKMKVIVDFYDNTNVTFDQYDHFSSVFYSRLEEIKRMEVYYTLQYYVIKPEPQRSRELITQSIQMHITENKLDITLHLNSQDPKLEEIYQAIKNMVVNAPIKYDTVIQKKNKITTTVGFAMSLVPAIVLISLLLFVPDIQMLFLKGYVVYPLCILFLAYVIGTLIGGAALSSYYEPILPKKKSAGFQDGKRVYKDDIDQFVGTSDILIGKKVNYLTYREKIIQEYEKWKKRIPKELLVLIGISVIVVIVGFFME